jgi:hypothetical protein
VCLVLPLPLLPLLQPPKKLLLLLQKKLLLPSQPQARLLLLLQPNPVSVWHLHQDQKCL